MDFHGLNDDQIFERVADEPAFARFEALIHMGMHRNFERIDEAIGFYRSAFELAKAEGLTEQSFIAVRFWVNALRLADRQAEAVALLEAELNDEEVAKVSDDEIGRAKLEYALVLAEQDKVDEAIKMLRVSRAFLHRQRR
jgi:tetratricopeptide (TPR) repeat protein